MIIDLKVLLYIVVSNCCLYNTLIAKITRQ